VGFVIQPIVIGNTGKNSAGKATEKDEKTSSGFRDLLKLTVETEKGKDVNVEILGLLTQMWPSASMPQPSIMTSSPAQLTENIEKSVELSATSTFGPKKEVDFQQEQFPMVSKEELTFVQKGSSTMENISESLELFSKVGKTQEQFFSNQSIVKDQITADFPLNIGTETKQRETSKGMQVIDRILTDVLAKLPLGEKLNSKVSFGASSLVEEIPQYDVYKRLIDGNNKISNQTNLELGNVTKESIQVSLENNDSSTDIHSLLQEGKLNISNTKDSLEYSLPIELSQNDVLVRPSNETSKVLNQENLASAHFPMDDISGFSQVSESLLTRSNSMLQNDLKMSETRGSNEIIIPLEISQENVKSENEIKGYKVASEILNENEPISVLKEITEVLQKGENSSNDFHTSISPFLHQDNSSPLETSISNNKQALPNTLKAFQFDKEIDMFVKSVFQVKDLGDVLEAAFTLTPEHMGKVDVKVSIVDGNVTAEFLTNTQSGKELLELNVQALRTALETQGFQVEKINITQQSTSSLMGSFSPKGDSNNGRHTHQDAKKRNVQIVHNQEKEYRDFDLDTGSQINTTA
jgi:flagellar hook-length control protein FliK